MLVTLALSCLFMMITVPVWDGLNKDSRHNLKYNTSSIFGSYTFSIMLIMTMLVFSLINMYTPFVRVRNVTKPDFDWTI